MSVPLQAWQIREELFTDSISSACFDHDFAFSLVLSELHYSHRETAITYVVERTGIKPTPSWSDVYRRSNAAPQSGAADANADAEFSSTIAPPPFHQPEDEPEVHLHQTSEQHPPVLGVALGFIVVFWGVVVAALTMWPG